MLKKIGEIEIQQTPIHVAKNGEYQLVCSNGEDAYGTPIYVLYRLEALKEEHLREVVQDLVQVVGKLLSEKQAVADSRRAALQGAKTEE